MNHSYSICTFSLPQIKEVTEYSLVSWFLGEYYRKILLVFSWEALQEFTSPSWYSELKRIYERRYPHLRQKIMSWFLSAFGCKYILSLGLHTGEIPKLPL